ncbi:MAG: hypothetical protein Q8P20_08660 [bacterium]|nr:hypothetical protein [bacterium]
MLDNKVKTSKKMIILFGTVMIIVVLSVGGWLIVNTKITGSNVNIEINPNILSLNEILDQFEEVEEPDCSEYNTKDRCIISSAEIKKNPRYCVMIVSSDSVNACYMAVASVLLRDDVCKLNPSSDGRKACQAVALKDITQCDVDNIVTKAVCYTYVAKAAKNADLCAGLKTTVVSLNQLLANNCYLEVAKAMNDVSICEKIKDDSLRSIEGIDNKFNYNSCLKAVESN